ncbi:hypothetical protein KQI52_12030 [bacterium]|nr:hypothetical protein [bacterium]
MSPKRTRDKRTTGRPVRNTFGYFIVELLIVFVGVFAAFQLSQFQQQRVEDRRRDQLVDALLREIETVLINTGRAADSLPLMIEELETAIDAGQRPPLTPLLEAVRVRTHMWEIAIRGGGLDVLDVDTMYRLSRFYSSLDEGLEQIDQLRTLSETVLVPNLGKPDGEFYLPDGQLQPRYQWYLYGMKNLQRVAADITGRGNALVTSLRETYPELPVSGD